jgi:16S rRNA (guanine(966)-N(2))-methyltransferase RsmD
VLKIVTGIAKGRHIETLLGDATRPTSQRIKEALFSAIQFDIDNRRVLDLFAGSGQLGLEAMSRGAECVTFVDISRESMDVVKKNAKNTGFFDKCRYSVADYRNFIRKASGTAKYDLVFIDPPYGLECCVDALIRLRDAEMLENGAIAVLESGNEDINTSALLDFDVIKSTSYGKKSALTILIYRRQDA